MKVKDLPSGKLALFLPFTYMDGTLCVLSNRAIARIDEVVFILTCGEHIPLPDVYTWNERDIQVVGDYTC